MNQKDYIDFLILLALIAAYSFYDAWRKKKKSGKPVQVYDERQKAARSLAFKAAFIVLAISSVLMGLLRYALGSLPVDFFAQEVLCVLLALLVWGVICIWNNAWAPLRQNVQKKLRGVWGSLAIFGSLVWFSRDEMMIDGQLSLQFLLYCAAAVTACTVLLTHYLRQLADRKIAAEDEDA